MSRAPVITSTNRVNSSIYYNETNEQNKQSTFLKFTHFYCYNYVSNIDMHEMNYPQQSWVALNLHFNFFKMYKLCKFFFFYYPLKF